MVIPEAANPKFRPLTQGQFLPALKRHGIETPYVLYVGSLEPRKNLLRLLEAYSRLRSWSDKWFLVIVGARSFRKSSPVVKRVEELGLEASVRFTGYVPEEDLPAIYNGADLFVFPSIYEGFGLPVLEAMACGAPVVTSNTSSLPEVAGDAAVLVDPYNVNAIAVAMHQVLINPALGAELIEKGLIRAAQFSWKRTALETISIYKLVLGKGG
jgi:glycosyltransferase involved in cell wall biosynthesis